LCLAKLATDRDEAIFNRARKVFIEVLDREVLSE
jgi:hypothetical protein